MVTLHSLFKRSQISVIRVRAYLIVPIVRKHGTIIAHGSICQCHICEVGTSTQFGCLGEKFRFHRFGKFYEPISDGIRVSIGDKSIVVVAHDSMYLWTVVLLTAPHAPMGVMTEYLNHFLNPSDFLFYTVFNRFNKSVTTPGSSMREIAKHFFPASFMDAPI